MAGLMRHVQALAGEIGPRGSCTAGERRALDYAVAEMGRWADAVWLEVFRSHTSFSWPWLLIYGASAGAVPLLWFSPGAALLVAVGAAYAFIHQVRGTLELGQFFPRYPSGSAVAVLRPRGAVRRRAVVAAHADTARSGWMFSPGQVPWFRLRFLIGAFATGLLPFVALGAVLLPGSDLWRWLALPLGVNQGAGVLLLLERELLGRHTRGANDNASGCAVALGLGEALAARPLEQTEVWFLVAGCEEVGHVGMKEFLDSHGVELRDACFFVLDNHGAGQVKYSLGEGLLHVAPADPDLVTLAGDLARRHPDWNLGAATVTLMTTDLWPVLQRGFRGIGFRAEDPRGLLPNWHWRTDLVEGVEPRCLETTAAAVEAMLREMDRSASGGDSGQE